MRGNFTAVTAYAVEVGMRVVGDPKPARRPAFESCLLGGLKKIDGVLWVAAKLGAEGFE